MSHKFTVSDVIPAAPREIYDAWLDSEAHGAMTGAKAKASAERRRPVHARWDGYISGHNLELVPGKRSSSPGARPISSTATRTSMITVTLEPVAGGTRVTLRALRHPREGRLRLRQGWRDYYFEPMKAYFAKAGRRRCRRRRRRRRRRRKSASRRPQRRSRRPPNAPPLRGVESQEGEGRNQETEGGEKEAGA